MTHFFLSYAHTAPLAGMSDATTDYWVGKLFDDLSNAVRLATDLSDDTPVGFFDGVMPAGADRNTETALALGTADVFVPLLSTAYFAMSWPGREWTCFAARLSGASETARHIIPVLWAPLNPHAIPPAVLGALPDDRGVPEYAANGLRALNMLGAFRRGYEAVIEDLANQIVQTARDHPLGASVVPPPESVPSAFRQGRIEEDFAVFVLAPTSETTPEGRDPSRYGATAADWRPFGSKGRLRLAEYAANAAEHLGFSTLVLDAVAAAQVEAMGPTPGVVLIDPCIAAMPAREEALQLLRRLFASDARTWTLPLVVVDADQPLPHWEGEQCDEIFELLQSIGALATQTARRGARGVGSIEEFAALMPVIATEAERQYLKYGPGFRPQGVSARQSPDAVRTMLPDETQAGSDG